MYQIITLYTLNLHVCQWYLDKAGRKKNVDAWSSPQSYQDSICILTRLPRYLYAQFILGSLDLEYSYVCGIQPG